MWQENTYACIKIFVFVFGVKLVSLQQLRKSLHYRQSVQIFEYFGTGEFDNYINRNLDERYSYLIYKNIKQLGMTVNPKTIEFTNFLKITKLSLAKFSVFFSNTQNAIKWQTYKSYTKMKKSYHSVGVEFVYE